MVETVPRRILVIRLSSLGDVLLSTALIRQLRKRFPKARLEVIVDQQFSEVYQHNPYIDYLWTYDRQRWSWRYWRKWRQRLPNYDLLVDLQKNLHSFVLRIGKARQVRVINKDRWRKLVAVHTRWNPYQAIEPIPERYRRTVADLGVADDGEGLEFWLPEERSAAVYPPKWRRSERSESLVAVAPGARHATKRWPLSAFVTLIRRLAAERALKTVLIGGPEDQERCQAIAQHVPEVVWQVSCSDSLAQTARWLDRVRLLVSNDSAAVHLAAARRCPVVVLYGSTIPEFGFVPYRVPFQISEVSDLTCRPCTHYGRPVCPKRHFRCMRELKVDMVVSAVERLLQSIDFVSLPVKSVEDSRINKGIQRDADSNRL